MLMVMPGAPKTPDGKSLIVTAGWDRTVTPTIK
jgi:hypothetical protein